MTSSEIPPMTWVGLVVAICVIWGLSYFAMKAGSTKLEVRENKHDGDSEHHKGNG